MQWYHYISQKQCITRGRCDGINGDALRNALGNEVKLDILPISLKLQRDRERDRGLGFAADLVYGTTVYIYDTGIVWVVVDAG